MTGFQSYRTEQFCGFTIVAIIAAILIPQLASTRSKVAPPELARLCEVAAASSGTAALDSAAAAYLEGAPRFVNGRYLLDGAPGAAAPVPYGEGRHELDGKGAARVFLERTADALAVEDSVGTVGRVVLFLIAVVVGWFSVLMGRDLAFEKRGLKRVAIIAPFLLLNPIFLAPLHALALVDRVEVRGGEARRIRSWFGRCPTEAPLGRVRAVATSVSNSVCLGVDGPVGFRTEPACALAHRDHRLEATLLGALAPPTAR